MKQALINLRGIKAGILTEDEDGYTFQYSTIRNSCSRMLQKLSVSHYP